MCQSLSLPLCVCVCLCLCTHLQFLFLLSFLLLSVWWFRWCAQIFFVWIYLVSLYLSLSLCFSETTSRPRADHTESLCGFAYLDAIWDSSIVFTTSYRLVYSWSGCPAISKVWTIRLVCRLPNIKRDVDAVSWSQPLRSWTVRGRHILWIMRTPLNYSAKRIRHVTTVSRESLHDRLLLNLSAFSCSNPKSRELAWPCKSSMGGWSNCLNLVVFIHCQTTFWVFLSQGG